MKIKLLVMVLLFTAASSELQAQRVRARLHFPVGISIGATSYRPYNNAIWIGPEWRWSGGRYISVPGYWARPSRYGAVWVPGHWKYSRRGYRWVPGHWR